MTFVHMSVLAGVAVIALPIMLHLFGQRQPQLVDFPALRFVRKTAVEQSTSWQLRHFLLLLFRILLLGLLAMALAQPRVHNALWGSILGSVSLAVLAALLSIAAAVAYAGRRPPAVWGGCLLVSLVLWVLSGAWAFASLTNGPKLPTSDRSAPVAVAIVIDNSPAMGYVSQNQTRLERAKEMARWVLDQLPVESRVGVLSGLPVRSLALNPTSAKARLNQVELSGRHADLAARLRSAVDLVWQDDLERKEVYVITDLDRQPWLEVPPGLAELLNTRRNDVLVQIIDIGGSSDANWRLGDPQLSAQAVPEGGGVTIQVELNRPPRPPAGPVATVELLREKLDPRLPVVRNGELVTAETEVVDRHVVDLSSAESTTVELKAVELQRGTHHFTVRIDQSDPLAVDNVRYATVETYQAEPTLIVCDDEQIGRILQLIVDPNPEQPAPGAVAMASHVTYTQLNSANLDSYGVFCLYDPTPLARQEVEKLSRRLEQGAGLLIILGPRAAGGDPQQRPLDALLPGPLADIQQLQTVAFLDPATTSHPLFHVFGDTADEIPWGQFPVFRVWRFNGLRDDARTLMRLTDQATPIIIAHDLGAGSVLTLTTLLPQADVGRDALWNGLWATDDPWVGFGLLLGMIRTLAHGAEESLNWPVGAPVVLRNDTRIYPSRWQLFMPDAQIRRVEASDGLLMLGRFDQPGTYRLRGIRGDPVARGFSVNTPASDTRLERIDEQELEELLGKGTFRIARERSELESSIGRARYGVELYPLMMLLVAGLFLIEQAMSSRFYQIKFRSYRGD